MLNKLHVYPPGYKTKQKHTFGTQSDANKPPNYIVANQVSESILEQTPRTVGDFMQTLNQDQYQHLMNVLNNHLAYTKVDTGVDTMQSNQVSGTCFSTSRLFNSPKHWVIEQPAIYVSIILPSLT